MSLNNDNTIKYINSEETAIKSTKIRILPTESQRAVLLEWIHCYRYTYNKALAYIKDQQEETGKLNLSWMNLKRVLCMSKNKTCIVCNKNTNFNIHCEEPVNVVTNNISEFELLTPANIRVSAVKACCEAYKTALTNFKNGNCNKFMMGFKSKKKLDGETICIDNSNLTITKNSFITFCTYFDQSERVIKTAQLIPNNKHDYSIHYDFKTKNFDLLVIEDEVLQNKEQSNNKICAIDQGVKTFGVVFDASNGKSIELKMPKEKLNKLRIKIASMQSCKIKQAKINKHHRKISNIINTTHWEFANILTNNYDSILLPKFESQRFCNKSRAFNTILINTNRHYQFTQKLTWKCKKRNVELITNFDESYTSKTCTQCGFLNNELTLGDRVYNCKQCKLKVDRDYNGARNIYIKYYSFDK